MRRFAVAGTLTLALASAFAQQTVKIDTSLAGGWSNWGVSGNEHKFRQYATPPSGFFLREFLLRASYLDTNDARVSLKAPGEADYRLSALFRFNSGNTRLFTTNFRNEFFDSTPADIDPSRRRVSEGYLWQKLTENLSLSFRTRTDRQDQNFTGFVAPLHQKTTISTLAARGGLWRNGFVDLSYTDWRYDNRTDLYPDTRMQRLSASVMQQVGDNLALSGSFSRSFIRQLSATNKIDEWSFGGNLILGEDTNLLLDYRNDRLHLPTVQNAYDRSRQMARGRVVHRFGKGWSGQLGYTQLALERVRADHSFVDVPRLHTVDMQVSGRLSPSVRLLAKTSRQVMSGNAQMQTPDPRAQYWTSRWDTQLKLTARNPVSSAYLVFDWHENNNSDRDVTIHRQGLTVGVDWEPKPELEFYGEFSSNLWSGRTTDALSPDLNTFFPDAVTFTLGANWTISPTTWATANYTFFNSEKSNPLLLPETSVWGSFFTGSLHYRAGKNYELGLTFAPWQFTDTALGSMGYSTALVQLTAKLKF